MFSYIDPSVMAQLESQGQRFWITRSGERITSSQHSDSFLNLVGPVPLPMTIGNKIESFKWYVFVYQTEMAELTKRIDELKQTNLNNLVPLLYSHLTVNSVLIYGDPHTAIPLVRVHSSCQTGDIFQSRRCDCGPQFHYALEQIIQNGTGMILYLASHEGRGIGLYAKAITYLLQDAGQDTYQANERLGLPKDSRDFRLCAPIIRFFTSGQPTDQPSIDVLTNNPLKINHLKSQNLFHIRTIKNHLTGVTSENRTYLKSKHDHGHKINLDQLNNTRD